jgi:hypothetical protein
VAPSHDTTTHEPDHRPADELAALHREVRALTDRAAISALVDQYMIALDTADERGLDDAWYGSIFTGDVLLDFPIGGYAGLSGLAEHQVKAKRKWARTHHLSGNHIIALDGDRATVRAQIVATHVNHGAARPEALFDIGGHYEADAVRTDAGWRLCRLAFHLGWSAGELPATIEDRR